MENKITKIQKSYISIIESAFSEKYKNAFCKLHIDQLRKFMLNEVTTSCKLDDQLDGLLKNLNEFWCSHTHEIIEAIRTSDGYRLLLPIQRFGYQLPEHLKSLGIYFDSILMVDPLHFPQKDSLDSFLSLPPNHGMVRGRRLVLLEHVSNIIRAIPYMKFEEDHPLFLIVPELLNLNIERNHEESAAFLSQLFHTDTQMCHDEFVEFIDNFQGENDHLQRKIINPKLMSALVDNFQNVGQTVWVGNTETHQLIADNIGLETYGLSSTILTLLGKVEGAIYAQRTIQISSSILEVDPVIYNNHFFLHEWIVKRLVKDYESYRSYSTEEQAIAMGLTSNEVDFLTAISPIELQKIREKGRLESLRRELRMSRALLQKSSHQHLQKAAKEFSNHLLDVVKEYGEMHSKVRTTAKKQKIKTGVVFAGSATLGIASLVLPQFTPLGIAATGIGMIWGGKSFADIYNENKTYKKEILKLEHNPISLLYGAYKRNGNL